MADSSIQPHLLETHHTAAEFRAQHCTTREHRQRQGGVRKSMGIFKTVKRLLSAKEKESAKAGTVDSQPLGMGQAGLPGTLTLPTRPGALTLGDAGPLPATMPAAGSQHAPVPTLDLSKPAPFDSMPSSPFTHTPSPVQHAIQLTYPATAPSPLANRKAEDVDTFMTEDSTMAEASGFIMCASPASTPRAPGQDYMSTGAHSRQSPNALHGAKAAYLQQQKLNPVSCPPLNVRPPDLLGSPMNSPVAFSCRPTAMSPLAPGVPDPLRTGSANFAQARPYEMDYMSSPVTNRRHTSVTLQSVHSARLSSCPSGRMSPNLRRGSVSTTLRHHISLKGLLNLGSYDFVPDVDVSQAQQEVDSSDDEDPMDGELGSAHNSSLGYGYFNMLGPHSANDGTMPLIERDSNTNSATGPFHLGNVMSGGIPVSPDVSAIQVQRVASLRLAAACNVSPRSLPALPMGNAFARPGHLPPHGSAFGQPQQADPEWTSSMAEVAAATAQAAAVANNQGGVSDLNSQTSAATMENGSARLFGATSVNSEAAMTRASANSMNIDVEELIALHQQGMSVVQEVFKEKASNILAVNPALPRAMRRSMWSVNDFNLHKCLHKGYASHVYSADCKATAVKVVLKVYRLSAQCDLQRVQLYREICVHSKLQHQNIIQFYAAFLEDNCVVIVQEFAAGGDLLRYMYKAGGRLSERQAVQMVLQPFLAALQYLHTQGIIHRDIKPENCLLTEDKVLKLADFGLAVDLRAERANTRAGTLDYMAPEVLRCPTKETPDQFKTAPGAAHYEMGADAWAVGVFAYELVVGGPPFKAEQMIDTARNIMGGKVQFPEGMTHGAVEFISSCLKKHPGDRPTVMELLKMPWITTHMRRQSVVMPGMIHGHTVQLGQPMVPQDLRVHASVPHPGTLVPGAHMAAHGMGHPAPLVASPGRPPLPVLPVPPPLSSYARAQDTPMSPGGLPAGTMQYML